MLAQEYPVRLVGRTLNYAPSTYYYRPEPVDDSELRVALQRLAGEWPTHGRPWLTERLRREGWIVNHKRVGRLMKEMGLAAQPPARKVRTTNSEHLYPRWPNRVQGLTMVRPDQVCILDPNVKTTNRQK